MSPTRKPSVAAVAAVDLVLQLGQALGERGAVEQAGERVDLGFAAVLALGLHGGAGEDRHRDHGDEREDQHLRPVEHRGGVQAGV